VTNKLKNSTASAIYSIKQKELQFNGAKDLIRQAPSEPSLPSFPFVPPCLRPFVPSQNQSFNPIIR